MVNLTKKIGFMELRLAAGPVPAELTIATSPQVRRMLNAPAFDQYLMSITERVWLPLTRTVSSSLFLKELK